MSQPLIAVRIKDGLFVGNSTAAQDDEFLFLNKVQCVLNCCSMEVPNLFAQANVQYLSFPWRDLPNTVMFDSHDKNIDQIYQFIEKGLKDGECVLVHSVLGQSRCCAVVAAYLMMKYGWTLDNTLTFMSIAHPDMQIKPFFLRQLRAFSKRQPEVEDVFHPYIDTSEFACDNEQWMLRNTYLNSLPSETLNRTEIVGVMKKYQLGPEFVPYSTTPKYVSRRRITYIDTKQGTNVASAMTIPLTQGKSSVVPSHSVLVDTDYIQQRHALLSSVNIDPKGRQNFKLLSGPSKPVPPTTASLDDRPRTASSYEDHHAGSYVDYPPRVDYSSATGFINPNVARQSMQIVPPQVRPLSAPPTVTTSRTANTVHSPFVLRASAGARKGSPMPESRRQSRESTTVASLPPNSFVPASSVFTQQQRTSPRTSSPVNQQRTVSTHQQQKERPESASFSNPTVFSSSPVSVTQYGNTAEALLPKKTYTALHQQVNPQRASSPTQRKTALSQPSSVGVQQAHMDPQMTLGMGLRNIFPEREQLQPRTATPTGTDRLGTYGATSNTLPSHRVLNGGVRNATPTDRTSQWGGGQGYTSYGGLGTTSSGGPRAARPTMTSLKKNVRST